MYPGRKVGNNLLFLCAGRTEAALPPATGWVVGEKITSEGGYCMETTQMHDDDRQIRGCVWRGRRGERDRKGIEQ